MEEIINVNIDSIRFQRVEKTTVLLQNNPVEVYDLEIDEVKNYQTKIGIAHNGGGKRKGSFAMYLEPWHPDVFEFLELRKNTGKDEQRCRDLYLALWIPDLLMKRVKEDGNWTLMDPAKCKGLIESYGEEFEKLYTEYESKGMGERTVKAHELWKAIITSQIETSFPYMLYKDAANSKSNQKNLGVIRNSNLCTEIMEYVSPDEVAVCNLASVSLPSCVEGKKGSRKFNHEKLHEIVEVMTENLNKVIDVNYYPIPEAKKSNMRHRPIGIGVQGLADVFAMLRYSWESPEARLLNEEIFETIYHAACKTSNRLAKETGPYETFPGCPASQGILQFDMWNIKPKSGRYDWDKMKKSIIKDGLKNSLLLAPMPTASTANVMGNTECFEPITSNIYKRSTLSGEFTQINKYLVEDLLDLGLWNDTLKQKIIGSNGSIQHIEEIPNDIKALYKTVWELSQKIIIDMAADRGAYVCQSQSLNIYLKDATIAKISSMHMYGWEKGLKTGMYYLRQQAAQDAVKITVDVQKKSEKVETDLEKAIRKLKELGTDDATIESMMNDPKTLIEAAKGACSLENPGSCEMCSG